MDSKNNSSDLINGFANLVEAGPVEILSDAGPALVGDIIDAANKLTEEEYEKLKEGVIKLHMPDKPSAEDENDVASAIEEAGREEEGPNGWSANS